MTEFLRTRSFPLTAGGILVGIALMATRSLPVAVIGVAFIVAGLLVPFAQLRGQNRDEQKRHIVHTPDVGEHHHRRVSDVPESAAFNSQQSGAAQ